MPISSVPYVVEHIVIPAVEMLREMIFERVLPSFDSMEEDAKRGNPAL